MMERSASFTAVPGYGGMLMGTTAVVAAYIANRQVYLVDALAVWLIEAFLAFAIGLLAMWQKSKIAKESLFSAPARKFAFGFIPPLVVGMIMFVQVKNLPVHKAMLEISELIYATCAT